MSKTFASAQSGTRTYLDESAAIDWLDSEVNAAINFAYHDVVSNVIEVYENFYETTTPFTYAVTNGTQEYLIDSSLIKATRVEVNYKPTDPNSVAVRAVPVKSDELRLNLASTLTAGSYFNAGYYLHGNIGSQKVGLVPIPIVSDTTGKSLSVWGIALPADLVNSTDDINIPYADRFTYLVTLRAAAQLLRKGQQEEATASRYIQEYQLGLVEMKTFLKERQADDSWMIADSQLEDIDFSVIDNL